jgi:hypothetical protein
MREFVHSPFFQRRLHPLASALLPDTVLGGPDVRRILKSVTSGRIRIVDALSALTVERELQARGYEPSRD